MRTGDTIRFVLLKRAVWSGGDTGGLRTAASSLWGEYELGWTQPFGRLARHKRHGRGPGACGVSLLPGVVLESTVLSAQLALMMTDSCLCSPLLLRR